MTYNTYQSPFSWRYGSQEMREVWSEIHKRYLWRKVWVDLAEILSIFEIVTTDQVNDLRNHYKHVDIERSLEIEALIHHDLMAELKTFTEQTKIGGGILHLGATSSDIEDNVDVLRIQESLILVLEKLRCLLLEFARKIEQFVDLPIIAFTHLQPAEPTTLGYRFAGYAQDLFSDFQELISIQGKLKGKGFKGAVGSAASFGELLGKENIQDFELTMSEKLGIQFYPITTQVYPRKQEYQLICALSGLGISLYKFAFDLRILQSPPIGELSEPYGKKQVGSSAMPFKRNPINSEKIDSLSRVLAQMPRIAWDNAAHSLLERTLDDSANRRFLLPESFLIVDEMLEVTQKIINDLQIDHRSIQQNLEKYGPFAGIERVLMNLVKRGANRQEMHERLRDLANQAWEAIRSGQPNPLTKSLSSDVEIRRYISKDDILDLMRIDGYLGNAPIRAKNMATLIINELS
jgi:adenylosuccinate lyase